jgi:hypothetical protein
MSAPTNDGGNAFPHAQRLWDNDAQSWAVHSVGGMTLRDYFAGQALAGFVGEWEKEIRLEGTDDICDAKRRESERDIWFKQTAFTCFAYADAMLAARKEVQP